VSKSTFSVARVTTTSFAVAIFALTGCSVGLQAEGTTDFEAIGSAATADVLVEALERSSETSFAHAIDQDAPVLTPQNHDGDHIDDADLVDDPGMPDPVEEEPVEVEEPAEQPAEEPAEQPAEEPVQEPAEEPAAEESDVEEPEQAYEENEQVEESDEDKEPVTEHEEDGFDVDESPSQWASVMYAAEDSQVAIYADVQLREDGTASWYGALDLGEGSMDMVLSGAWENADRGDATFWGSATDGETTISADRLSVSDSCGYALGGTITIASRDSATVLHFSEECDSCFAVIVDGSLLGKGCMD